MAACNQTDIPVLNIQEDPCIQGSLITSCIFYGLAIDYLGAQSSSSFFDVLGLIVAKLEAGNIDATNLEEDNRAQALLIEALQNSIAESLVTLSEIQVLLEQCCPEPTTTTVAPTTTTIPTSTTTTTNGSGPTINANYSATPCDTSGGFQTVTLINGTSICDPNVYLSSGFYMLPTQFYITYQGYSRLFAKDSQSQFAYPQGSCIDCSTSTTTTTATNSYSYTVSASSSSDRNYTCSNPYTSGQQTLWANTYIPGDVQKFYTDSNLTNPYLGNVNDYYAYMIGWPSGILYVGQMGADGTMFNKSTCQQATTTTTTTNSSSTLWSGRYSDTGNKYEVCFGGNWSSANVYTDISSGPFSPGTPLFTNPGLTTLWPINAVMNINDVVYTIVNGYTVGAGEACSGVTTTTTTAAPTTTTTTTATQSSYVFGTTGLEPFGIVIDTEGNIYTSNAVGNNITKITPSGVSTILGNTGQTPIGITIDTEGNVYAANYGQSNVTKITPSGVSTILGTTGSSPVGIVIDTLGNVYTANQASNNVTKITPSGVSTVLGNTGASPRGIAIDADGNIYTANYASANITKITPSGVSTNFATNGGQAQGITVDSTGNIYVANTGTNNVSKITPGGVTTILGTTDTAPQWIAVDTAGNVYTSNANVNNVTKITPSGVSTILGTTGIFPQGIVIDTDGNVYTANRLSNNVTKIVQAPTTTTTIAPTTVAPGLTCPEGFPNRTTGNGTMTLSNGVTLTTAYTGPTLLSGNFNPPFTACGNSFKGNDGAGGTMYLNYTGGAFTLTLTFSQPQSHIAFGIFGMGIYNQPGTTESYTFTTNGGGTQITELNGCGNFQVQGFNTLVGSNNNGTASDGSGAIQVTSSGLFTEVTITGNNSGSLNGVGIDLYLCSNLIIE